MDAGSGQPTGSEPSLPEQPPTQQLEGLRAWIAQVDRKLSVRSYAGGAAVVLALAAGIVGVVLATSAKDESATKAEVAALSDKVSASTQEASRTIEDELGALGDRIDTLEGRVSTIASSQRTSESELQVAQDDIDELRGQITDLQNSVDAAAADQANLGNDAQSP